MSLEKDDEIIPGWAAAAGGVLLVMVLVFTAAYTLTREPVQPITETLAVIDSRDIAVPPEALEEVTGDRLEVMDATDGSTIAVLDAQQGGFIRGVLRTLASERPQNSEQEQVPFRLTAHANGRLAITDLATGRVIDINAFGQSQAEAFAALL